MIIPIRGEGMFSTDALVRVMQAFWDKAADAPKNLAAYLDHYI